MKHSETGYAVRIGKPGVAGCAYFMLNDAAQGPRLFGNRRAALKARNEARDIYPNKKRYYVVVRVKIQQL